MPSTPSTDPLAFPIAFAGNPLDRANQQRTDPDWLAAQLRHPDSLLLALYEGAPLVIDGRAGFLSTAANGEFAPEAPLVFLGIDPDGRACFGLDATASGPDANAAPFSDIGHYMPMRTAAGEMEPAHLAIAGQARWLLDWHRRHQFCSVCGTKSEMTEGGMKRTCPTCGTDHFPRTDPVAIVLVEHEDHCLLGRGPHFPPGFVSCLAGFVEACETLEACAIREVKEEAGVTIHSVHYQFSQPWPFPSSLMMGVFAQAEDRALTLDTNEIEEARWLSRTDIQALIKGAGPEGVFLPPTFTIARQLLERWAHQE